MNATIKNSSEFKLRLILLFLTGLAVCISCTNDIIDKLTHYPTTSEPNVVYYVDADEGSDEHDGKSPSTAWKTFKNMNYCVLQAGNKVLLKKGCTWYGQLAPKGSGTPATPIIVDAYGEGNPPIIDGKGEVKAALYLKNQSNWTIQNLELKNAFPDRGNTYRCGILVENDNGGTTSNIKILNNYVHDVSGSFRYGPFVDPHQYGGIAVNVIGQTGADKYNGVLIEGNKVERAGRTGIVVWDNIYDGSNASVNVVIRGNKVKDIDSDGILTFGCVGALIEHNVADGCGAYREDGVFNGAAAIWCTRGSNCIIQYNEAFNTHMLEGNNDGTAFDIDLESTNCIVQYNYSHDNEGGFMLLVDNGTSSGSIVRYNISQNDGARVFMFSGGVTPNTQIYNNTVYLGQSATTKIIDHAWDDSKGNLNAAWSFKNNIIYNLGSGNYRMPGTGGTFAGNLYYGSHPANEPNDVDKLTDDPLFVNPGSGGEGIASVDGYKLQGTSTIINTGVKIQKNGGFDFWGNVVSSGARPTRGAHEPNGTVSGQPEIIDKLDDTDKIYYHTPNLTLDGTNSEFFGGDASRAVRTNTEDGIIIYRYPNIKAVTVTAYLYAWENVPRENVQIWGSFATEAIPAGDLSSFQQVSVAYDTDPEVTVGWQKTTITVNALPDGVNYIGVRMTTVSEAWHIEIGEVSITYEP